MRPVDMQRTLSCNAGLIPQRLPCGIASVHSLHWHQQGVAPRLVLSFWKSHSTQACGERQSWGNVKIRAVWTPCLVW